MRDVIVVFGLVMLGVLSSLAVSLKFTSLSTESSATREPASVTAQQEQPNPAVEQFMADAPPSERRGTPGERS